MATAKKSPAKKTPASKSAAKKTAKKPAKKAAHCWPGFQPVPGTTPGEKGSCEPRKKQTASEKKADSRAAAGSKLHKAGGSKSRANKS